MSTIRVDNLTLSTAEAELLRDKLTAKLNEAKPQHNTLTVTGSAGVLEGVTKIERNITGGWECYRSDGTKPQYASGRIHNFLDGTPDLKITLVPRAPESVNFTSSEHPQQSKQHLST